MLPLKGSLLESVLSRTPLRKITLNYAKNLEEPPNKTNVNVNFHQSNKPISVDKHNDGGQFFFFCHTDPYVEPSTEPYNTRFIFFTQHPKH